MKKITAKQYAMSLYESIKDSQGKELSRRIENFLLLLKKRKQLKLLPKIYNNFVQIYQERQGELTAEVISAAKLSGQSKKIIINWLKNYSQRQPTIIEKVEAEILGGLIIKFEDTILDASLLSQLKQLQQSMNR